MTRAARVLVGLAALVCGAALLATLAWLVLTFPVRPLDGVEGDVLFEALRLRAGAPLWVDPAVGALEYGLPPARYYVLYPPLWSAVLALAPTSAAPLVARALSALAWLGVLAFAVRAAPRGARRAPAALAAFAAGAWVLTFYGASGRPDALAVALAGVALLRASRAGRVDVLAGALFALAACVKPNVLGAAPGALLGAALAGHREGGRAAAARRSLPGVAGALGTGALVALVLTAASGRAWLTHLLASTGQAPSGALWAEQMASRAPFFALPLLATLAVGLRASRASASALVATSALATSLAWCALALAKIGSAANYFLEPFVAAVVVLAHAPLPKLRTPAASFAIAGLLLGQALWTGIASVRSAVEHVALSRARAGLLREARTLCGAPPSSVVIADEPGLELALDGRIVETPFQSTHLGRRGAFPIAAWREDVRRPEVACLVMQDDLLERPLAEVSIEHDRFGPELRGALREAFVRVEARAGWFLYRRAPASP